MHTFLFVCQAVSSTCSVTSLSMLNHVLEDLILRPSLTNTTCATQGCENTRTLTELPRKNSAPATLYRYKSEDPPLWSTQMLKVLFADRVYHKLRCSAFILQSNCQWHELFTHIVQQECSQPAGTPSSPSEHTIVSIWSTSSSKWISRARGATKVSHMVEISVFV